MLEKLKTAGLFLERTACKILLAIMALISWGLAYYSLRYTETLRPGTEIPMTAADSAGRNLLVFSAVTGIFFLLRSLLSKKCRRPDRLRRAAVAAAMVYVTVISVFWVANCHVVPRADSSSLCTVAEYALQGRFETMAFPGYMAFYPGQFSLLLVIQTLFRLFGAGNYQAFQYMNALCMPLLFYSGYRLLMLTCGRTEPVLYYIAAFVSCVPLFLYVPYVYGEITSITFTMVLMWQVVRCCVTGRRSGWLWGTLAIVFACMTRMNSMIVLIAAGIVLAIYALRTARLWPVVWFIVMILAVASMNAGVRTYYETVSGREITDSVYVSWILMGIQEGENGPGWHDGTDVTELMLHNYDTKLTAIDDTQKLKERLRELWENKPYAIDFFRRKVLSQWNSPAWHSLYETGTFDCEQEALPGFVSRIYDGKKENVTAYMNRWQAVLYLCTAVMVSVSLFSEKQTRRIESLILLIPITGGFLFSIIWEAMSRYVLPYVAYMLPVAAVGMWRLQQLLDALLRAVRRRLH